MKKVNPVRIPVYIKTELISDKKSYAGIIGNLSGDGAFVETVPTRTVTPFIPGKTLVLKFKESSGISMKLNCEIIWLYTKKVQLAGFANSMGMKIISPTPKYKKYLKSL